MDPQQARRRTNHPSMQMASRRISNHLTASNHSSILSSHMANSLHTVNSLISNHPMANLNILKVALHSKASLPVKRHIRSARATR